MRKIAVVNKKGGVGKTSTVVNLGAALAKRGKKVLIVDMDEQGHVAQWLSVPREGVPTTAELLINRDIEAKECIQNTYIKGLDVIPAKDTLGVARMQLATMGGMNFCLRKKLKKLTNYDYIFIDCPPSFETLTINACAFADEIIVPFTLDYLNLEAVSSIAKNVKWANENIYEDIDHRVEITGVLVTMFMKNQKITKKVMNSISKAYGDILFKTKIPQNVKMKECIGEGQVIFDYAPSCPSANAYEQLMGEFNERGI
ncbi:hypothetical protein DID80_06955 [Candidatus Marinamargulisbacteria bacterium SCGC AAA071-K20]|nr:hypothetical protein DID80_06955 [Candidatus Marinamargulisbacteria bacterium SCGC AAA071-K20]